MLIWDRSRMFALLTALENDLREIIDFFLLGHEREEIVFGPAHHRASARAMSDTQRDLAQTSLLHYLDLGDEIEILNRLRRRLPSNIAESMSSHAKFLENLIPIRNRVMHSRPLLPDDASTLELTIRSLLREGFKGDSVREIVSRMEVDPSWSPFVTNLAREGRVLNNLPLPDYDETGLIGRRRVVENVRKELVKMGNGGRNHVLTITGPGGVGKTALALQTLHDLVDSDDCPFDLVSWVSLKTERLTAAGITEIANAVRSLEDAVPILAEAIDRSAGSTVEELGRTLEELEVNALLVIDNLETVSGSEVLELIDQLPDSVVFLLTSREGLGQIERRVQLEPLDTHSSVSLLRGTFKARGLNQFAAMAQPEAEKAVSALGCSPLGIKWFVAGVEAGKDPSDLLRNHDDLISFCVSSVFESLEMEAQVVARILVTLGRPLTMPEIKNYASEFSGDVLRRAIQALLSRVLINRNLVEGSLVEAFEASHTLSSFLMSPGAREDSEVARIRFIDSELRREADRHRLEALQDPLRPNVIQSADEHPGSVPLLRRALTLSKTRDFSAALLRIEEAAELDPDFWEIYRVKAFVLSCQGNVATATRVYEQSINLAPDLWSQAVIKHFFASHMLRGENNSIRGEELARESHEILQSRKSAVVLGTALTWLGRYEEAEAVLEQVLEGSDGQVRLIATTQLVDCIRRHAEYDRLVGLDSVAALGRLRRAIELADAELEAYRADKRLVVKAMNVANDFLNYFSDLPVNADKSQLHYVLGRACEYRTAQPECEPLSYLRSHLKRLVQTDEALLEFASVQELLGSEPPPDALGQLEPERNDILRGRIKAWREDKHFGFVSTATNPDGIYMHLTNLYRRSDEIGLRRGAEVELVMGIGRNETP